LRAALAQVESLGLIGKTSPGTSFRKIETLYY
jgi:hypothetical protein